MSTSTHNVQIVASFTKQQLYVERGSSHLRVLRLGTLAIPFTPLCQCISDETLKAVGSFYLVSMPGEVKYPTSLHWKCVTYSAWARTTKRGFSLPVSGQRLIMFFGELIMSRIQNDVIAVLIL